MNKTRRELFVNAHRIIVKVGSGVLSCEEGLNLVVVQSISAQISRLVKDGRQVILVSSGAVASGMKKIGLTRKPQRIPEKQAAAAIGQAGLMRQYEKAFSISDINVAQVLLTGEDTSNRKRYLNSRNTLNMLLSWGVVPIVNENDTVAIEEIKFGDNDNLSAMIALMMDADALVNLTDIDGLYTKDPRQNTDASLIPVVTTIGKNIEDLAGEIPGALGTGGMRTKIRAAKKVCAAGIPMTIASGAYPGVLEELFSGQPHGTYFAPKKEKLDTRKRWIAFSSKPTGEIMIDRGAQKALLKNGTSLLPSGITSVHGDFGIGAPVNCVDTDKNIIGVGLVNYSSSDIKEIMGLKSAQIEERLGYKDYDEVIHRNNLAITCETADQGE